MAKKKKQPTKTCADCIHESACRIWTDGRFISDASGSVCPNHETVKESAAYLCGVLDERKRKQTNADRIRAMSNEELAEMLVIEKAYGVTHEVYYECPCGEQFDDGEYKKALEYTVAWLKQPAEV